MNLPDLVAYVALILAAVGITWWLIASSTRSKRIARNTSAMVKILAKMAEKQGVDRNDDEHLVKWTDETN